MARGKGKGGKSDKRQIERYEHKDKKRVNNPPVGLVTPATDPPAPTRKTYEYDPHLDPQLVWAGKKEHTSFEVPTVSLHVHERIDPRTIVEALRKRNGNGRPVQPSLFERPEEKLPLRDAIDFYRHAHGWSNRLVAGDSLLVMNSLLEKEGMAGKVQMVYIDPPYGIKYGSNFQPFVNKRDVKDGKDEDLTQEPEMIRAFRDTWELGIHSYVSYLRDRLLLARELLHESGSCLVQISDENVHLVKAIMDEVFKPSNFVSLIYFRKKTMPLGGTFLERMGDYLVWFAKDKEKAKKKYRQLWLPLDVAGDFHWNWIELPDGTRRQMTREEADKKAPVPRGARVFRLVSMWPPTFSQNAVFPVTFRGNEWWPPEGQCWPTGPDGLGELVRAKRLEPEGKYLRYVYYLDDFPYQKLTATWNDTIGARDQRYVVETHPEVIQRCLLMTTDPGDLVLDPTCGHGTTAYVAEQWGRRWITCDTSRVSVTLAKERLMAAVFYYYELAHPHEGVGSGFRYEEATRISVKTFTKQEPPKPVTIYDRPYVDKSRARVSGPFTVEAVPAPTVRSLEDIEEGMQQTGSLPADTSVARKGATLRHTEWRDELLKTSIRGKGGQKIDFSRVEPLAGTRWLHADAETKGAKPERVVFSFGPEHGPLEQRQVEMAWEEARTLIPKPSIIVFAAFQFDPEAAKDIDELTKEKTAMTFLTAQMNADLLTEDLKKKRASNQSFWLVGRPDVDVRQKKNGEHKGKWEVEVRGFDYYNTRAGTIESGDTSKIAMWLLDTDYDGRSLYPRQVFFPLADEAGGWARLAKNLKSEIDPGLIEAYRGTVSLPFGPGEHKRVAVKVIDDRGIESLKIVDIR